MSKKKLADKSTDDVIKKLFPKKVIKKAKVTAHEKEKLSKV